MDLIQEERLLPGSLLPSARELAARWGISRPAVSRVLHQMEGSGCLQREGYKLRVCIPLQKDKFVVHAYVTHPSEITVTREIITAYGGQLLVPDQKTMRKSLLDSRLNPPAGIIITHRTNLDVLSDLESRGTSVVLCHHECKEHSFVTGDYHLLASIAVDHLRVLGHREISFFIQNELQNYQAIYAALSSGYRTACLKYGLRSSAQRLREFGRGRRELTEAWNELFSNSKPVTAILCANNRIALALLGFAAKAGIKVPQELSIMTTQESAACATCEPPLTAVGIDRHEVTRIAAGLLCRDILERRQRPSVIRRYGVNCQPVLLVRASTSYPLKPLPKYSYHTTQGEKPSVQNRWANDAGERIKQAALLNARQYGRAASGDSSWHPLNLRKQVNRALQPRSSWLGDLPLLHFKSGRHDIHGIPFDIAGGKFHSTHSAIVLRSSRSLTSGGKALPKSVTLPVNRKVQAVYLLHATGWVVEHECIANYQFVFDSGRKETLPVISYGPKTPTFLEHNKWIKHSLVQDWHPSMEPFSSDHALPYLVMQDGDPLLYERYLYTCQWRNQFPEENLRKIKIASVDPESEVTLGILAITLEIPFKRHSYKKSNPKKGSGMQTTSAFASMARPGLRMEAPRSQHEGL